MLSAIEIAHPTGFVAAVAGGQCLGGLLQLGQCKRHVRAEIAWVAWGWAGSTSHALRLGPALVAVHSAQACQPQIGNPKHGLALPAKRSHPNLALVANKCVPASAHMNRAARAGRARAGFLIGYAVRQRPRLPSLGSSRARLLLLGAASRGLCVAVLCPSLALDRGAAKPYRHR